MSTIAKTILRIGWVILIGYGSVVYSFAQDIDVTITLSANGSKTLQVAGALKNIKTHTGRNWSFPNSYSDAGDLAKRISTFSLTNDENMEVPYKEFSPGEFLAESEASGFSYQVELPLPQKPTSAAHISWIGQDYGLLMLNDILPRFNDPKMTARILLKLPPGWDISTNEKLITKDQFEVTDVSNAIFLIGNGWRERRGKIGGHDVNLIVAGEWEFTDEQAYGMTAGIFAEYSRILGDVQRGIRIFLIPFPEPVGFDRWRAETRGGNVVIISSKASFKSQALQRLHEQLRHEILHPWIPNSLNLIGDYAWFYEGFVVYEALKSGVWLGQIRFEDFLNTLNRAKYLNERRGIEISLLEVSRNRWEDQSSSIYARGMLIGFLTDIALLKKSGNKRDVTALFGELLKKHGKKMLAGEANDAILSIF
ncbi:MAG: hypothetical protein KDB79_09100, partial [Acidobacteria bacterium]|nr:hypothetical protein [Acidobacteriota bacterium]